jgi:hypothetical protein
MKPITLIIFAAILPAIIQAAQWRPLFNGKNLDGWEIEGESIWTVVEGGILAGQRPEAQPNLFSAWPISEKQYHAWFYEQSWLYTKEEFASYDLYLEYWIPPGRNSGVSLCDSSRGRQSFGEGPIRTPAHIGYEIQILASNDPKEKNPTGSIYQLYPAKPGLQRNNAWNTMNIEYRPDRIRVTVNGTIAAEGSTDPARPKHGPIGLQLHDRSTWILFRNIRIRKLNSGETKN